VYCHVIAMVHRPMIENAIWPTAHRVVQPIQRCWVLHLSSLLAAAQIRH
jgi:hypothetical protein